ncbi:uncharacterized protein Z519_00952 [Cladophialophora bantiana CBS 173.52]|uniref:Fumarylacetoacetase-like C-terminal domain-containing protein n=1 Tax=Cladophialophora bantiana (strain ATCC 10958 / CBS 173.52 / CDC B-1940 / NIH 8579) TaxID=1442370 RepID=A0A0D2IRA9_CLAB1|nr:uncharacterized protein Z519_00952 [Cladophialophora bantiana CBS 173.52]KIW99289.1 hypothetical protein Z519_00952 [Cladophialophora bantiana CBS 173.52]
MAKFSRLVRFEDPSGNIHYGEAGTEWQKELVGQVVPTYDISDAFDGEFALTGNNVEIAKVLCPVTSVPIIIGIGLNYKIHAEEAKLPIPEYPVVFTKFADTLAGPFQDIHVDAIAKELDYEGELSVVIGKDVKNLKSGEDPFDYVLGYTVGNDVSARYWQWPNMSGSQHGYAKSFDNFGPIGPVIASQTAIPKPESLKLKTWVNGELRQDCKTDDLIFGIARLIEHLSQGMTLRKGTVIMTGTPNGVAAFLQPRNWLKDGDVVKIEIEGIGAIENKMVVAAE